MPRIVTVLVPIKTAQGVTEKDFLDASARFQTEFVYHQPGILRREVVRKAEGTYIDIVQFRSAEDLAHVMELEQQSEACHALFSLLDMNEADIVPYASLSTYNA